MEKSTILAALKHISDVYFEKKDYISSSQINRAIDVIEDYNEEFPKTEEDEIKDLLMENFHASNEQFVKMAEEIIKLRKINKELSKK